MRMMMKVTIPVEAGNKGISEGLLPKIVMGTIERVKPECSYFTTNHGERCAIMVFDLKDPSDIPSIAEPFFNGLHARVEFAPVMTPEDLKKGLEKSHA